MEKSKKPVFNNKSSQQFYSSVRKKVNSYFEKNNKSRFANNSVRFKVILILLSFVGVYLTILLGGITQPGVLIGLFVLLGMIKAGIGLNIMHDANHNALSRRNWVNQVLGYTLNLLGANSEIWKLQHNKLHHTYTNIEGVDDDLNAPFFLRFSPNRKHLLIHKFQFLYASFFYCFATLSKVLVKEFVQLSQFSKRNLMKDRRSKNLILIQLLLSKILYIGYILVLPIVLIPVSPWVILLGFFLMHAFTGLTLTLIFQTAHVMPDCKFPLPDSDGQMDESWILHEMNTTTNYSPKSRIFSYLIGGLNYQVEHHLFPNICHVHYRKISVIVASTAKEFNMPYNSESTFLVALKNHFKMLYKLGRVEKVEYDR